MTAMQDQLNKDNLYHQHKKKTATLSHTSLIKLLRAKDLFAEFSIYAKTLENRHNSNNSDK